MGPIVTEWPLQQLPQFNVSRVAPARGGTSVSKPVKSSDAERSYLGTSNRVTKVSRGGQFVSGHARKADIALFHGDATLALEVNGDEHSRATAKRNDRHKENGAKGRGLRVHAVDICKVQQNDLWQEAASAIIKKLTRKQKQRPLAPSSSQDRSL